MKVVFFNKVLESQNFFDDICWESQHICVYSVNYAQKLIFLGAHACAHYRDLDEALDLDRLEQNYVVSPG